jgi:formyltetrahydrofolate deformylase
VESTDLHRLLVSCPDRPGIVAAVSSFLASEGGNIVASNQYSTDPLDGGRFFMRTEFALAMGPDRGRFEAELDAALAPLGIRWELSTVARPKRIAVLASRYEHCVLDLLWRGRRGQLGGEVALIASNHPDLGPEVERFGIPFHHVPVPADGKQEAERRLLALIGGAEADLVVLARYMQILSGQFLDAVGVPVINIHHSFLPAFAGADPYRRARERGVKLIGATAHYVTEDLDAGPIIEQDVTRVSHEDDVERMVELGEEIERLVLARAVRWHCEDRLLRDGDTTVVFD